MMTDVGAVTAEVERLKPPALAPAAMNTEGDATATAGLLLVIWKIVSEAAGDDRVTLPVPAVPPIRAAELSVSAEGEGSGVTVSDDAALAPFQVAVIEAVTGAATALVASGNETDGLPAGIVT